MGFLAGLGIAADLVGGVLGHSAQSKANKTNIKLAREQRDWDKEMSSTAWQRAVTDMKAAGINPMLAVSQGPASTPSTSAATVIPEDAASRGVHSAASKALLNLQAQQLEANIGLTNASAYKATQEGRSAAVTADNAPERQHWEIQKLRKEIEEVISRFSLNDEQRYQIHALLPLLEEAQKAGIDLTKAQTNSAKVAKQLAELQVPEAEVTAQWFRSAMGGGGRVTNALKDILQIIGLIRGK